MRSLSPSPWANVVAVKASLYAFMTFGLIPCVAVLQFELAWLIPRRRSRAVELCVALVCGLVSATFFFASYYALATCQAETDYALWNIGLSIIIGLAMALLAGSFRLRRQLARAWQKLLRPLRIGALGHAIGHAIARPTGAVVETADAGVEVQVASSSSQSRT